MKAKIAALRSRSKAAVSKRLPRGHKHARPYLLRHVGLLLVALVLLMSMSLQLGVYIGQNKTANTAASIVPKTSVPKAPTTVVYSSHGFSLNVDLKIMSVEAFNNKLQISDNELDEGLAITDVKIKMTGGSGAPFYASTQLDLVVYPNRTGLKNGQNVAEAYPYTAPEKYRITGSSTMIEQLDGVDMQKTVYTLRSTEIPDAEPSHTIQWTGLNKKRPIIITLRGIPKSPNVPDVFAVILDSLDLDIEKRVAGVSTSVPSNFAAAAPLGRKGLEQKYVADAVSPAVVKIYHFVCGSLVYQGLKLGKDSCQGMVGSGFIVSSDGYVATNGHVVVYTAKDALVESLLANRQFMDAFLQTQGLNDTQIRLLNSSPELLAGVITKIYDLPDNQVRFENERKATLVALGEEPITIANLQDISTKLNFSDTPSVKKADVLAVDFSAKDVYSLATNNNSGFTASDVALLKINIKNAPTMRLSATNVITQNQAVTIMGFPADAENQLTQNNDLNVTITNGSISAIRQAAGGRTKLYQSDVDASHGNSGGPAVTSEGYVFGLMTYRFQSGDSGNAAKSYIRDVADFAGLATKSKITLNNETSEVQKVWEEGLVLFSENRFSQALKKFEYVRSAYPPHRLADSYIAYSKQSIADGKDVNTPPVIVLSSGALLGLFGIAATIWLMTRHR